jgi:glutathione S-transferase
MEKVLSETPNQHRSGSESSRIPLELYFHPLSSYCQKVLIALYENDTPFKPRLIDLGNEASRAELTTLWPIGKFPVLRDDAKDRIVPESSIIIEYLAQHYPGKTQLVPADADLARQTRMRDRFYDMYVNDSLGKIVADRLRPTGKEDPYGVEQAKARLETACGMVDRDMSTKTWAMGEAFSMADCAAAPALFYANLVMPLGDTHKIAAEYLDHLMRRPSFARVVKEAEPYLALFPT